MMIMSPAQLIETESAESLARCLNSWFSGVALRPIISRSRKLDVTSSIC